MTQKNIFFAKISISHKKRKLSYQRSLDELKDIRVKIYFFKTVFFLNFVLLIFIFTKP